MSRKTFDDDMPDEASATKKMACTKVVVASEGKTVTLYLVAFTKVGQPTQLSGMPVWAFHGQRDESVPVAETTKMIDAIELAGGTPQLTVYPEGRHNVWNDVYQDNTLFAWLLSQQLPDTAAANALARP